MNYDELDTLALILFTTRHRSRRLAKRLLREAGGAGTATELDAMLRAIDQHPQQAEIENHVQSLACAALEANMREQQPGDVGGDHPLWLQAEDTRSARSFLLYLGSDCAFLAELLDDESAPKVDPALLVAKLDEGQWLGNVLWLDDPPPVERQIALWLEARRELRVYDKGLGL